MAEIDQRIKEVLEWLETQPKAVDDITPATGATGIGYALYLTGKGGE